MARKVEGGPNSREGEHGAAVAHLRGPWSTKHGRKAPDRSSADLCLLVAFHVRRARLAAGLSQEELAERCGLDRTYVSGIERGRRNPTVLALGDLAAALGIRVADLLQHDKLLDDTGTKE